MNSTTKQNISPITKELRTAIATICGVIARSDDELKYSEEMRVVGDMVHTVGDVRMTGPLSVAIWRIFEWAACHGLDLDCHEEMWLIADKLFDLSYEDCEELCELDYEEMYCG